jgi:hypothetical protein
MTGAEEAAIIEIVFTLIFWVAFTFGIYKWAENNGRAKVGWAVTTVLIGPIIPAIYLLFAGKTDEKKAELRNRFDRMYPPQARPAMPTNSAITNNINLGESVRQTVPNPPADAVYTERNYNTPPPGADPKVAPAGLQ